MAPKKRNTTTVVVRGRKGAEFRFNIGAYSPLTMPMARLAEYITRLAEVLGEPNAVHFLRVDGGSTAPLLSIDPEALPKVRDRIENVRRGHAVRDAQNAYRTINKMLREDNAVATLHDKAKRAVVLKFPGKEESAERFTSVKQHGTVDGLLLRVGGIDETVPVLIQSEGRQIYGINTNRQIAKQLAQCLFEPVRLSGKGRWSRDAEGVWNLDDFRVEYFEPLESSSLSEALAKIRTIDAGWNQEALDELSVLRHGAEGAGNGGR